MARRVVQVDAPPLLAIEAITAIEPAPKKPGWMRVRVGRRTLALLHRAEAERLGVQIGQLLTIDLADALEDAAARSLVRRDAERLLARRTLAESQLVAKLLAKQHSRRAVEAVAKSLRTAGAIDDAKLAEAAAHRALRTGKRSASQAVREVAARGVSTAVAKRAIAAAATEAGETDFDRALALAKTRLRGEFLRKDADTQRRRLGGILARRGYDHDTVERVLERVVGSCLDGEGA